MEMCDRKYMFGDKSTFGSNQNGQNMPKKGQQEFFFFFTLNKDQLGKTHIKKVFFQWSDH